MLICSSRVPTGAAGQKAGPGDRDTVVSTFGGGYAAPYGGGVGLDRVHWRSDSRLTVFRLFVPVFKGQLQIIT